MASWEWSCYFGARTEAGPGSTSCWLWRLITHPPRQTFLPEGVVSTKGQAQRNLVWSQYQERKAFLKKSDVIVEPFEFTSSQESK